VWTGHQPVDHRRIAGGTRKAQFKVTSVQRTFGKLYCCCVYHELIVYVASWSVLHLRRRYPSFQLYCMQFTVSVVE